MNATIITIGDELLIGQTIDTNSAWIGKQLNNSGISIYAKYAIQDSAAAIHEALTAALKKSNLILITGGLGPTSDDITVESVASYFGLGLVNNSELEQRLERMFAGRGAHILAMNRKLAFLPETAIPLHNSKGSAAGIWLERGEQLLILMPGVPYEMRAIMEEEVLGRLQTRFQLKPILHRHIMSCGKGETEIADLIADLEQSLPPSIKLAYLPSLGAVKLRLSSTDVSTENEKRMDEMQMKMASRLGEAVYAFTDLSLEEYLQEEMIKRSKRLGVAESCTGGSLAARLVAIPNSSNYFAGSVVVYDYGAKERILKVRPEVLERYGAVSEECVHEMLEGVKKVMQTDYAIAISGIAGPGGGTAEKPVGTVYIGVSGPHSEQIRRYQFTKSRSENIHLSVQIALNELRKMLLSDK